MATIGGSFLSLADHAKRMDPDGKVARIVEMLATKNSILDDAHWEEGNLPTGHRITARNGLPGLAWRRLNEGVAPTKSNTVQYDESCGILSGYSYVDPAVAKLNGNAQAFRASEDMSFVASMRRAAEDALVYASTKTNPERLLGLAPRLDSTSTSSAPSQIVKATTSASGSDQTSVYVVGWGPRKVYLTYPKASQAGISHTDLGDQLVPDSGGTNRFHALVSKWEWQLGLAVEDSRYLVRLCNIDTSATTYTGQALIIDLIRAVHQMQDLDSCRPIIYMNRTAMTLLQTQSVDAAKNGTLTYDNAGGRPVMQFMGIPVHRTDSILNTEAVVS